MNYFVTKQGEEYKSNLTREQAVTTAKSLLDKGLSTLEVGIGRTKIVKGKRVYTLLPAHFCL